MEKSVIELTRESIDKVILRAIEGIHFSEIQKWAQYFDGDVLNDCEDYLDDNGNPIMGYLIHQKSVILPEIYNGKFEVCKEIYILPNGNYDVFYATHEGAYENDEEEGIKDRLFWRTTRVRSKEKSLSQSEIQDFLFDLLTEVKKKEQ